MANDRRPVILMLDDSDTVLELASRYLHDAGYEVRTASDVAGFERQHAAGGYDLVLLDVQMPEMYGDDIGAVLRAMRAVSVPIYLFSSVASGELHARVAEACLDGFIPKQDGMDALVERVRSILG